MSNNKTVLIVDDDIVNRTLLRGLLEDSYVVDEAANGSDCLAYIQDRHPDLIILDILMPNLDGDEICYNLKKSEQTKSIPIIVVSSLSKIDYTTRFGAQMSDAYLTKPIDGNEVIQLVDRFLNVNQ